MVASNSGGTFIRAIVTDNAGNIYTCGGFKDTVDFDFSTGTASLISSDSTAMYLAKYDANGNYTWVKQIDGPGRAWANHMALDADGNVYLTGVADSLVDFDPSANVSDLSSPGGRNVFIAKYSAGCSAPPAPATDNRFPNACYNETLILQATGSGTLGWYSEETDGLYLGAGASYNTGPLTNGISLYVQDSTCMAGPRKAIFISVETFIDTAISLDTNTLSSADFGSTYQWIDCNNNTVIANANERSFKPSQSGSYAVILKKGSCSDTSACMLVDFLSIRDTDKLVSSVFPNPVNELLTITNSDKCEIRIYAADGTLVEHMQGGTVTTLNTSNYTPGLYLVVIDLHNRVFSHRFVKH